MNTAPILLFAYNRPHHLHQTIEALQKNILALESDLYIYSDAAKSESEISTVLQVREFIKQIVGFRSVTIVERECNYGLAANVIDGVSTLVEQFGKIIVLEDDLITSPYFLTFMNQALDRYQNDERVCNVQAHVLDTSKPLPKTFFIRFVDSWGWATWKRAWDLFEPDGRRLLEQLEARGLSADFDFNNSYPYTRMLRRQIAGENNSWAIRWNASLFIQGKLSINAGHSLVKNIGFDGSGQHCDNDDMFATTLFAEPFDPDYPDIVEENSFARNQLGAVFAYENTLYRRARRRIKQLLY